MRTVRPYWKYQVVLAAFGSSAPLSCTPDDVIRAAAAANTTGRAGPAGAPSVVMNVASAPTVVPSGLDATRR